MVKVCIDPGHGGHDSGVVGNGQYLVEKQMVLISAFETKRILEAHGVQVMMTRTTDVFVGLSERARKANAWGANYFVSQHYNGGGGVGLEIIHSKSGGKGKELAVKIADAIKAETGQKFRPNPTYSRVGNDGKDYYAVIRETNMDAVIVEPGFVDSVDVNYIGTPDKQRAIGAAVAHAILRQCGIAINGSVPSGGGSTSEPVAPPSNNGGSSDVTGTVTVTCPVLNLRSGPGTNYGIIRKLYKGEPYKVFAEKNGFYNLGGDQWCSADPDLVSFVPANGGPQPLTGVATVICDVLNLRKGPGTNYGIIRQLKRGEPYQVFAKQNGFYNLGGDQWCSADPDLVKFTK